MGRTELINLSIIRFTEDLAPDLVLEAAREEVLLEVGQLELVADPRLVRRLSGGPVARRLAEVRGQRLAQHGALKRGFGLAELLVLGERSGCVSGPYRSWACSSCA